MSNDRYPVILNGDHAQFEAEWAGKDPKTRPDWPLPSFAATDWAEAFSKRNPGCDQELMVGWFANALMRGFDEGVAQSKAYVGNAIFAAPDLLLAAKEAALVITQIADAHGARAMTGTCLPRLLAAIKQAEG